MLYEDQKLLYSQLCENPHDEAKLNAYNDYMQDIGKEPVSTTIEIEQITHFIPNFAFYPAGVKQPRPYIGRLAMKYVKNYPIAKLTCNNLHKLALLDRVSSHGSFTYNEQYSVIGSVYFMHFASTTITPTGTIIRTKEYKKLTCIDEVNEMAYEYFMWMLLNIIRKQVGYKPLKPPYEIAEFYNHHLQLYHLLNGSTWAKPNQIMPSLIGYP